MYVRTYVQKIIDSLIDKLRSAKHGSFNQSINLLNKFLIFKRQKVNVLMISEVPLKCTKDILQKVNAIRFAIQLVYTKYRPTFRTK